MRSNGEPMALVRRNGILVWVPWNESSKTNMSPKEKNEATTQRQLEQQEDAEKKS